MAYPLTKFMVAPHESPKPIDFLPLYFKEASVTSRRKNLIFMRMRRLHDMLLMVFPPKSTVPTMPSMVFAWLSFYYYLYGLRPEENHEADCYS